MTRKVWLAKNAKGSTMLFSKEPVRDTIRGTWEGQYFVNYVLQSQIEQMLEQSLYSWQDEPEPIEFEIKEVRSCRSIPDMTHEETESEDEIEFVPDFNPENGEPKE